MISRIRQALGLIAAKPTSILDKPEYATRPLYFLHIPKTAGTAFRLTLEQQFADHEIFPNQALRLASGGYPPFQYVRDLPVAEFNQFRLFAGHYQYREVVEYFSQEPLILLMMRDPLARCLSECRHIMRHANHDMRRFLPAEPTLIDIAKSPDVTHYLANVVSMMLMPELPQAKQLIEKTVYLGIQERITESSVLLAATFGWPVDDIAKANVTPKSDIQSAPMISEEILAQFKLMLAPEYELYNFACELFASRLDSYGLSKKAD